VRIGIASKQRISPLTRSRLACLCGDPIVGGLPDRLPINQILSKVL
jgi:hypothetical protein